jgi:hypothetical protein
LRIAHCRAKAHTDGSANNGAGGDVIVGGFDPAGNTVACILFAGRFIGIEGLKRFALWRHRGKGGAKRLGDATAEQQDGCEGQQPGMNFTHRIFPV